MWKRLARAARHIFRTIEAGRGGTRIKVDGAERTHGLVLREMQVTLFQYPRQKLKASSAQMASMIVQPTIYLAVLLTYRQEFWPEVISGTLGMPPQCCSLA